MSRSVPLTPQNYEALRLELEKRLAQDAAFLRALTEVCGSAERLQVFLRPAGVSISAFAALLNVPASTVRHYQRMGLITPFEVNGKFRFWLHNLFQAEAVRQWRNLGLSLTEIQGLREGQRLGAQAVLFNRSETYNFSVVVTGKSVSLSVLRGHFDPSNGGAQWLDLPLPQPPPFKTELTVSETHPLTRPFVNAQLLHEVTAAREKLERHLKELQDKVERARQLETALREMK